MDASWLLSSATWAENVFSGSVLPDRRLAKRLVGYAELQVSAPRASTAKACEARKADREGAYRLLENTRVDPKGIDEGPYAHCVQACSGKRRLLAVQDTTTVRVHHAPLAKEARENGNPTGFVVHTLLMVCGDSGMPLGIADQKRWLREKKRAGRAQRRQRDYQDKESFKWERSLTATRERLSDVESVVSVCDREADIYEFLGYHQQNGLDFVIRASWNRRIAEEIGHVFEAVQQAPVVGHRDLRIEQRGAQSATRSQGSRSARCRRDVRTQLQATRVCLRPPKNREPGSLEPIDVNVVRVLELDPADETEPSEWVLLTSLPVDALDQVEQVVQDYERRWLIEEFHKCWKTGCRLETRPLQTVNAVERMMAITAPIGIRILQLQVASNEPDADQQPAPLDRQEWRCLWVSTCEDPLPPERPSARWAYRALAKMGGWYDSKRTGRAGWQTLWEGWIKLQERLSGWKAALRAAQM